LTRSGKVTSGVTLQFKSADNGAWLNPDVQDVGRLAPMLAPYPACKMEATLANDHVNNARHEWPECLAGSAPGSE
jgi:putative SOS response-associated peptidase YedK